MNATFPTVPQVIRDVTCTACGCLCDDIDVTVTSGTVTLAERACQLGKSWFHQDFSGEEKLACHIRGKSASVAEAIAEAAKILSGAKAPLVFGLTESTTDAQRLAAGIADKLQSSLDTPNSFRSGLGGTMFRGVVESTCTLGEIRHRADLVLFWGTDPALSHPRHFERYSLFPPADFLPNGRADRTCIVVGNVKSATAAEADIKIELDLDKSLEAIWVLRGLLQGLSFVPADVLAATGQSLATWEQLAVRLRQAKYGAIFYEPILAADGAASGLPQLLGEALQALTRDLCRHTRFVCRANRGAGNPAGADQVLTWRTGYPFAINLARGYPRFNPGEYRADQLLARQEVDAALLLGSAGVKQLPATPQAYLAQIPTVVLDYSATPALAQATVGFRAAVPPLQAAGTMYRMDLVPLPVKQVVPTKLPSDLDILKLLSERL